MPWPESDELTTIRYVLHKSGCGRSYLISSRADPIPRSRPATADHLRLCDEQAGLEPLELSAASAAELLTIGGMPKATLFRGTQVFIQAGCRANQTASQSVQHRAIIRVLPRTSSTPTAALSWLREITDTEEVVQI